MKMRIFVIIALGFFFSQATQAAIFTCPDPQTTSLKWGVPPAPWLENPFSSTRPHPDPSTTFARANIMVVSFGRGVICTYKTSTNYYSIWWSVLVKMPSREDYRWIDTNGGYVCTDSLADCQFSVAIDQ